MDGKHKGTTINDLGRGGSVPGNPSVWNSFSRQGLSEKKKCFIKWKEMDKLLMLFFTTMTHFLVIFLHLSLYNPIKKWS